MPPATPATTAEALESHGTNHQVGENRESDPPEGRATHDPCSLAWARTHPSEWTPCRMADAMVQGIPSMVYRCVVIMVFHDATSSWCVIIMAYHDVTSPIMGRGSVILAGPSHRRDWMPYRDWIS